MDRQFNQGNCVKCNEDCKKRMNLKQVEKHTTQRFRCLINHTCVFSMVCVGACKYAHISFPSRPEKRTINISRLLSRSSSLISTPSSSENVLLRFHWCSHHCFYWHHVEPDIFVVSTTPNHLFLMKGFSVSLLNFQWFFPTD